MQLSARHCDEKLFSYSWLLLIKLLRKMFLKLVWDHSAVESVSAFAKERFADFSFISRKVGMVALQKRLNGLAERAIDLLKIKEAHFL